MKFYSDVPNLHIVRQRTRGNGTESYLLCKFDENGEFETDNSEVIKQLQNIYRHEENNVTDDNPSEKIYQCKKCEFTTNNMGLLMAHYREHKKEG